MSALDPKWWSQEPFTVTSAHMVAPWCGFRDGRTFRCHLCGHFFVEGDGARFVMGVRYVGNIMVCEHCDGDDVKERMEAAYAESRRRFWWVIERERQPSRADYIAKHGNPSKESTHGGR